MAMGSSWSGRSATQKGATQDGGPESRNFRLQRKHSSPPMISYNKGQCNERLAQAVWGGGGSSDRQAEACARGRLRRKEGGGTQPAASTDSASSQH